MKKVSYTQGFTFLELIIVIAIFAMISGVVLYNSRDFTKQVELENTAQEIALAIKEAQTKAVSGSINQNITLDSAERVRYGVMFSSIDGNNELPNASNQFVLFQDFDPASIGYWGGGVCGATDECLDMYEITENVEIVSVCVDAKAGAALCNEDLSSSGVSVVFERPFPNALITTAGDGTGAVGGRQDVEITIQSKNGGQTKKIIVWSTGQLTVE
jgi:prepilin-type N-terminal cleavage/methylation domain-containing protein